MSENTVYIFVEGGCVEDVEGAEDYAIIDFDSLESGACPICGDEIEIKDRSLICYACNVDWDNIPEYAELIKISEKRWAKN